MRESMGTSYTFLYPLRLDRLLSLGPFKVFL
jgi:hypothetical protein